MKDVTPEYLNKLKERIDELEKNEPKAARILRNFYERAISIIDDLESIEILLDSYGKKEPEQHATDVDPAEKPVAPTKAEVEEKPADVKPRAGVKERSEAIYAKEYESIMKALEGCSLFPKEIENKTGISGHPLRTRLENLKKE